MLTFITFLYLLLFNWRSRLYTKRKKEKCFMKKTLYLTICYIHFLHIVGVLSKGLNSRVGWCSIKKPQLKSRVVFYQKALTQKSTLFRRAKKLIITALSHLWALSLGMVLSNTISDIITSLMKLLHELILQKTDMNEIGLFASWKVGPFFPDEAFWNQGICK